MLEQLADLDAERARDCDQRRERRVGAALWRSLQVLHMLHLQPRTLRDLLLGQLRPLSKDPQALPEATSRDLQLARRTRG